MTKIIKVILIGLVFIAARVASAEKLKVAIIDDGFDQEVTDVIAPYLCKTGHHDFNTKLNEIGPSRTGHGNQTIQALVYTANTKNICIITYKVSDYLNFATAIDMAVKSGVKVISMSLFALLYDPKLTRSVENANNKNVRIYAAAGNDRVNLNEVCKIYPQCLKFSNVIVIGALNFDGEVEAYSNYGSSIIDEWHLGRGPNGEKGTSIATPVAAGIYIKSLDLDKKGK